MNPRTVVVSLPVTDPERSLRFYRDGLGLSVPDVEDGILTVELPNLSLFLIEAGPYQSYLDRAGVSRPAETAGACILSCAMGTRGEIDDLVSRAQASGGKAQSPAEHDGSYTAYLHDPDGHVWELVHNAHTAART